MPRLGEVRVFWMMSSASEKKVEMAIYQVFLSKSTKRKSSFLRGLDWLSSVSGWQVMADKQQIIN